MAVAVLGLISQCILSRGEIFLTQLSPRNGRLHLTGHRPNLETMAVAKTLPRTHQSG